MKVIYNNRTGCFKICEDKTKKTDDMLLGDTPNSGCLGKCCSGQTGYCKAKEGESCTGMNPCSQCECEAGLTCQCESSGCRNGGYCVKAEL